jgi:hypothetical protein
LDIGALTGHSIVVRDTLEVLGPRPRERLALMLQGLGLSVVDAEEVIEHGLKSRLFELNGAGILRALPRRP